MKNFEKVEAYFNNELSSSEKADFLNEVNSNTELKSEYDFQNEVINGIKETRKAELKAMLNKVPITTISTATTGLYKIFVGSVATLLVGTATWYYFAPTEQIEVTSVIENIEVLDDENSVVGKENISKEVENEVPSITTIKEDVIPVETAKQETSVAVNTPNLPNSDNEFENQTLTEENLDIPSDISAASINLSSKVDVKIVLKKKYNFHYQYSQAKLVLYGEFEEGLFEVIELNKSDNIDVYLYYKANFYYIKNNTDSITPLKSVTNENLIHKLESLR